MRSVLLIDIPVVPVILPAKARSAVGRKLATEAALRRHLLPGVVCPPIPYSRGLLTVATVLRQAGVPVQYVNWSDEADRRRIAHVAPNVDVVGISCMTSGHNAAADAAALVRARNPRAAIVLGGHHATELGAALLDTLPIDAVVRGDGGAAMLGIARSAPELDQIPGVCTRRHPDTIPVRDAYASMPIPAYDLLSRPLDEYGHSLRTYHGCPYACTFCAEGSTWRRDSFRNLDMVTEELAHVLTHVPKGTLVHFSDPVFNVDHDRTAELCQWLTEHARGRYLSLDTRADLLSWENVRMLRQAGFRYFRIGFESLIPDLLNRVRKGWTPAEAVECLRGLRAAAPDVVVHAYWITGLPGSTTETMKQSLADVAALLASGLIDILSNKVLVPYPGTFYYEHAAEAGLHLLSRPWAAYDRLSPPVYELNGVTSAEVYEWFCETERVAERSLRRRLSALGSSPAPRSVETYKSIAYMNSGLPAGDKEAAIQTAVASNAGDGCYQATGG